MLKNLKIKTDEELAILVEHNIEIFEELMTRYEARLFRYIARIANFSQEENEELLQEIFLKVWKNINSYSSELPFSSWIYRIAHNETISRFRKLKYRGETEQVEYTEDLFIADKIDFIQDLNDKYTAQDIHKVLSNLDQKYREILVLKFLEEKSYEEIADILKLSGSVIATRINRAKNHFREVSANLKASF